MAKKNNEEKKEVSVEEFNEIIMDVLNKEEKVAYSLNDAPVNVDKFISTGSTILDYKISNRRNGGIPVGRITEITKRPTPTPKITSTTGSIKVVIFFKELSASD